MVGESHAAWYQAKARQLPAQANQRRHQKFHLMPIQVTADADIVDRYDNVAVLDIFQGNAFIDDRAISRATFQGVAHYFRGSYDIIEPSHLAKIGRLGQMKSQKVVL